MTWDPQHLPDLSGQVYAITGATGGIGYFAAEQVAAAGAEVVLLSRSQEKLERASRQIAARAPGSTSRQIQLDLTSLESVATASERLSALPRLDGIFLNGGPMQFSSRQRTSDGLPLMLGAHTVANVALVARLLPALRGNRGPRGPRIVHASTGFVAQFATKVDDVDRTPRTGIGAYIKAKTLTEIFGFELHRRLAAAGLPVASVVTRPGVGVDAKTPERPGIRDGSVRYQRNPYTPWAQGKDAAAWSGVRALADPSIGGGEYVAPAGGARGEPVTVEPLARTARPDPQVAARVWRRLTDLAGVRIDL